VVAFALGEIEDSLGMADFTIFDIFGNYFLRGVVVDANSSSSQDKAVRLRCLPG
jgi:hypothetical protein